MNRAITLPFEFDGNGRVGTTTDIRKILQDRVLLVVMSLLNERVMRPDFGTDVRGSAFENLNDAETIIKTQVETGVSKWLPYLNIIGIETFLDSDNNLNVDIKYKFGTAGVTENITVKAATLTQSGDIITEALNG